MTRPICFVCFLQIYITEPVVAVSVIIHLASDGYRPLNRETKYMHVNLITTENQMVPIEPTNIPVNCWDNPMHIAVKQDLSKQFTLTKG